MRRVWRAAAICLLALVAGPSARSAYATEASGEIASLYVKAASEALADGLVDRAARLVAIAREFDPGSSDALFLAATIERGNPAGVRTALQLAALAIESDAWVRYTRLHAMVLRASLQNRTGAHDAAASELAEAVVTPDIPSSLLSDYYYERVAALHALDLARERDALLRVARDRFPDQARFYWFTLQAEPSPSREYRRDIEHLIDVGDGNRSVLFPSVEEIVFVYGERAPTPAERAWAVEQLDAMQWAHPALALLLVRDDAAGSVDRYLGSGGLRDFGVYRALRDAVRESDELASRLGDAAAVFTGSSVIDPQRDGVANERIVVESGRVTRWDVDADQDGRPEIRVDFDERAPRTLVLGHADGERTVRYGQYPFVDEVTVPVEAGRERYVLRHRSVRLESVVALPDAGPIFGSDLRPARPVRVPAVSQLVAAAVRIDLVGQDGVVLERSHLSGGSRREVQRDTDRDGAWDHLILTDGGFATRGLRDLDGDGYFEVAEGYRNGSLVALAVDSDDDGMPDVFEQTPGVPVREWDLNEDGRIDVREFAWWTESVLTEFPLAGQEF